MYKRTLTKLLAFVLAFVMVIQNCGIAYATESSTNVEVVEEQEVFVDEVMDSVSDSAVDSETDLTTENVSESYMESVSDSTMEQIEIEENIDPEGELSDGENEATGEELIECETVEETVTASSTEIAGGSYGKVEWNIDANGKLTVTGTGEVRDEYAMVPWYDYSTQIKSAVINLSGTKDLSDFFCNCQNMTEVDLTNLNTEAATDMGGMFSGCINLGSVDLSKFDTSNVEIMSNMFFSCMELRTLDVSGFNTENVWNMSNMFSNAYNITSLDLSSFDTKNLLYMDGMFAGNSNLKKVDLSSFDLTDLYIYGEKNWFYDCRNLVEIKAPKNLSAEIVLPLAEGNGLQWVNIADDEVYTYLPMDSEESIHLVRKDISETVTLSLDDIVHGTKLKMYLSISKDNDLYYQYETKLYYNDTPLEYTYSYNYVSEREYNREISIDVSDVFGGKVSGNVRVYAKTFNGEIEVAESNEITISVAENKLPKVTNIRVNGNTVTWDAVEGAASYYAYLSKKTGANSYQTIQGAIFDNIEGTTLDISEYESEVARISVRAQSGDSAVYLHSDYGQYIVGSTTPNPEPAPGKSYKLTGDAGYDLNNGKYSIIAGGDYLVQLFNKNQTKANATSASLYMGKSLYTWSNSSTYINDNRDTELDIESVSFNSIAKSSTKDMELRIETEDGVETKVPLIVYPTAQSVTVSGVKNGKLTQSYQDTKSYALTVGPNSKVLNLFDVVGLQVVDNDDIVDVEIKDGKLQVTPTGGNGTVDIKLYNKIESRIYEDEPEWSYYEYLKGGEFTLEITGPTFTSVKPTVVLQDATNTKLTLKVGAKGIAQPEVGKLWYEVTTELVNKADAKHGVYESVTQYYPYEKDSQEATIAVANVEADGTFPAVKNDIKVSVVQTSDNTSPSEGGDIIYRTNASSVAVLKNASTKAATYETKLVLKKGTTKIFTGQEAVVIATPQFSKTTYFKNLNVEIQDTYGAKLDPEESGILVGYDKDNGKILVTVDDQAMPGKYNLKATVATPAGIKAVSATVAFEVVYGINTIWFDNLPAGIYKKAGTATTISLEYYAGHFVEEYTDQWGYTQGGYSTNAYKQNVEFSVVGEKGQPLSDELKNAISIKNGKLTIDKKYVPTKEERFCIQAKAADYVGNKMDPVISYSIGISGYKEEMGEIVLGYWNENEQGITEGFVVEKYVTSNPEDKSLCIDDVRYLTFAVLRKGVEKNENNFYTFEEVIGSGIKVTSSSKNLGLSGGFIQWLTKEAKNITITATATDGSGVSISVKGITISGTKREVGVAVHVGEYGSQMEQVTFDAENKSSYNGILGRTILQVQVGTGDLYNIAANYATTITGAKVLNKSTSGVQFYILEPNAKDVTIKVQNKNTGETTTYTLTNSNYDNLKELGTVKVEGSYIQYSATPSYVTIKLPNGYAGKYAKLYFNNATLMKDSKYMNFAYNSISTAAVLVSEENSVQIPLLDGHFPMDSGNFKLAVCVGNMATGEFVPETKCKDVTFKVTAAKAGKANASSTLNLKDTDTVVLGTNVKGTEVVAISSVENINSKGVPNRFTDYFKVDGATLKLKDDIDVDLLKQLYSGKAKEDLKGWVTCIVKSGDYYQQQSLQLTVNAKNASAGKYVVPSITVAQGDWQTSFKVSKTVNKVTNQLDVSHVTADKYIYAWDENGNVCIDLNEYDFKPGKTTKVTLYAVDEDAPAAVKKVLDEYEYQWEYYKEYEDLIKVFGNKLTPSVTVVKAADIEKKDKVKIAASSVNLTDKNLDNSLNYTAEVGYTELIEQFVVSKENPAVVEVKFGTKVITEEFAKFVTIDTDNNKIIVSIPQSELSELVDEKVVKWKASVSVNIKFNIQDKREAHNYPEDYTDWPSYEETDTLKITLPTQPKGLG